MAGIFAHRHRKFHFAFLAGCGSVRLQRKHIADTAKNVADALAVMPKAPGG